MKPLTLEEKIDKVLRLMEEQDLASLCNNRSPSVQSMAKDLVLNTVLASAVGYFMFRIMDAHFGGR